MRQRRNARPEQSSFQHRPCAITDTALWKHADDASAFKPIDGRADRGAVCSISIDRETLNGAQDPTEDRMRKKFSHRHPINFSPQSGGDDRWIEMTNVVGRQ